MRLDEIHVFPNLHIKRAVRDVVIVRWVIIELEKFSYFMKPLEQTAKHGDAIGVALTTVSEKLISRSFVAPISTSKQHYAACKHEEPSACAANQHGSVQIFTNQGREC